MMLATTLSYAAVAQENGAQPHEKIDALYQKFTDSVASMDVAALSEIYEQDALLLSPQAPLRIGEAGVQADWDSWFAWMKEADGSLKIDFEIVERRIHDDAIAYDVGYAETLQKRPNEPDQTYKVKFLHVFSKQPDGEWLFEVDAYNYLEKQQ